MQLLGTSTASGLSSSSILLLSLLAIGTSGLPSASPQEEVSALDVDFERGGGWEFTGWRERNANGEGCSKKNENNKSNKVLGCTPIGPNKDAEINGYSFDGKEKWKLCLFESKDCKKVKQTVDAGGVTCRAVDGAKAYKVVKAGKDC